MENGMPSATNLIDDVAAGEDALARDPAALMSAWRFRLAVLRHDRAVYRVARALLRDEHEAADVVQDVFLRFWEQGGGVREPRHWLLRVARNACFDRLRRSGRLVSHDEADLPEPGDDRDPAWHYQQDELGARLRELVATLPEPQRSLIELFDGEGFSGAECAAMLGLSPTQVKVYLHRARRKLRARLERSP
jgi:RNA polymerase sigma-70 factor, ECF subfamily